MKKFYCGLLFLFLMAILNHPLQAQLSNYSFSQQTGQTYTTISGGTVLIPAVESDDDSFNALPIGFTFKYCGSDYSTFAACTNGFLGLGSEILPAYYYQMLESISSGKVIAAFGGDLYKGPTSELMYKTEGSAPSRVLTVQYKNFTMFSNNSPILNFQIKLHETTNQIELCYGAMSNINSPYSIQAGLTGNSNADLLCRTTTSNWTATTSSNSIQTCTFSSTVYPPSGLVFIYSSAPVAVATAATAISTAGFSANWGSVSGVTSYLLEVSSNNFASQIAGSPFTIAVPTVTKGISGLNAGTAYRYRIQTVSASGTSAYSNIIDVTTSSLPTITSAIYDAGTGVLVVSGSGFVAKTGAANDIDVTKLTIKGEGGATYTLTSPNVEITSATSITINLNGADQTSVRTLVRKNGTSSIDGTAYNLAAAEDWAAGTDAAEVVADLTGNGITVSNVAAPTVLSVSVPTDGTYKTSDNLNFTVNFSENVAVTTGGGTPAIPITLNTGGIVNAGYISGSGTTTLVFSYIVVTGNLDDDGISLGSAITANGGTIKSIGAVNANLTLNSVGSASNVKVDAVAPTMSTINRQSPAGSLTNAGSVIFRTTFSESITGVDVNDFSLITTGTATGTVATIASVSGSFYDVTVNSLIGSGTLRLDLKNSGTGITDNAGNAIAGGYTTGETYTLDTTSPTVSSVGVPSNATYTLGQNLDFTINFSEAVTAVTTAGTPHLTLIIGSSSVQATYLSGTGTTALVFRYTNVSGDLDTNGISLESTVTENGGTLKDAAGNNAELTLNSVPSTTGVLVDAIVVPVTQASALVFADVQSTQMNISWTNGNGAGRVVFVKAANSGTTTPTNNTFYTANTVFSNGSQLGTGWYCAYNGTGTGVTVTGLSIGTDYVIEVFEYNGSQGYEKYNTSAATNNPKGQATPTCGNPVNGGTIATDQAGCTILDVSELTSTLAPSGYTGILEYMWQKSTTSNSTGFSDVVNSNIVTYTPGSIVVTTWYKRLARVACMSGWTGASESNVVKMTVNPATVGGSVTGGSTPIIYGSTTGTMTLAGQTGSVLKWQKRVGSDAWSDIANTTITYSEIPSSAGTWQYRTLVKSGTCSESYSETFNIVVNPKALTVKAVDKTKIYDGTIFTSFTVNYNGFVEGETPTVLGGSLSYIGTATSTVNAGTNYVIKPVGLTSENYNISFVEGQLDITKRALTVTATGPFKEYGTALISIYDSANFIAGATGVGAEVVTGVVLLPDASGLSNSTAAGAIYHVYPSLASGTGGFLASNYEVTYLPYNGIVSRKALMITAENKSKNYGAALPALTVIYNGLTNGDAASATPPIVTTTATSSSPVATYPIIATGATDPNYTISYTNGVMTVEKAILMITADNKSKNYGASLPALTVSYAGLVNGDTVPATLPTISTTATASGPVATYPILISGADDPNYTIDYTAGLMTVNKVPLMITANNQSKNYGASLPALTVSYAGLVNGNSAPAILPTVSTTATQSSPVATYPVVAAGAADPNYSIGYTTGSLTVNKVPLIITADNKSKNYGAALPLLTVTYEGLVNDDLAPSTPAVISTTAKVSSPVATYPITVTGASDPNYSINYAAGVMTVNRVPLLITADNKTKNYGAPLPMLTVSYTGLVNGDTAPSKLPGITTPAVANSPVSTYPITATGATDPNYSINYIAGVLTVGKSVVTVTADSKSKSYGSADPFLSFTVAPALIVTNTFTGMLSRITGENVGSYAIGIGTLNAGINYTIEFVPNEFSISAKTLTISTPTLTTAKIYDGSTSSKGVAGTLSGIIPGDESNVNVSLTTNYVDKNKGVNKTINVVYALTGSASGNYTKPADYSVTNGEILARQLAISNTIVTTNKMYDGNASAVVESVGTLSGIVTADVNNVIVTAVANYNDANVGTGKTITVVYTIGGSAAGNYLTPSSQLISNAKISEKVELKTLLPPTVGCEGSSMELDYSVLKGTPVQYRIIFGEAALAAGFQPIEYTNLPTSAMNGVIPIPVNAGLPYGNYAATLQMRNELGIVSDLYTFLFIVNVSSDYIIPKFDDVVLCNNDRNSFTSFQWFKNGKAINGATKQYYTDPQGLVGSYSLRLLTSGGQELYTCPKVLNKPLLKKVTVNVYPNPAKINQESTVQISGLSAEELQGASMRIYNVQGVQVYSTRQVEQLNSLNLQNLEGVYMGHIITADGKDYSYRILLIQ